jgi:hypothetical protein
MKTPLRKRPGKAAKNTGCRLFVHEYRCMAAPAHGELRAILHASLQRRGTPVPLDAIFAWGCFRDFCPAPRRALPAGLCARSGTRNLAMLFGDLP